MSGNEENKTFSEQAERLSNKEKQALLFSGLDTLNGQLAQIRTQLSDLQANPVNNDRLTEVERRVDYLDIELIKVRKQVTVLTDKLVDLESYGRRSNLIFYGVSESKPENCEEKVKFILRDQLQLDGDFIKNIKFERVHRLGKPRPDGSKPRPIIAKFNWFKDREAVWNERRKLKGTLFRMSEDFPQEIIQKLYH